MLTLVRRRDRRPTPIASAPGRVSIFNPICIGIDEFGHLLRLLLIFRNMLIGGEPGSGKSGLLNVIVAHAALALDCRLVLLDGKQVELGQWAR